MLDNGACKTSNKLEKILSTKKRNNGDKFNGTGVYKLNCSNCDKVYIGQTGRTFKTRFKEHLPKTKTNAQKSQFADHLVSFNHNIDNIESNMDILHKCSKGPMMDTLETYEIYKSVKNIPDKVLNEKLKFNTNILFDRIQELSQPSKRQQLIRTNSDAQGQVGIG